MAADGDVVISSSVRQPVPPRGIIIGGQNLRGARKETREAPFRRATILRRKRRREEPMMDEVLIRAPSAKRALGETAARIASLGLDGPSTEVDDGSKGVSSFRLRRIATVDAETVKKRSFARRLFSSVAERHAAARAALRGDRSVPMSADTARAALESMDGKFAAKLRAQGFGGGGPSKEAASIQSRRRDILASRRQQQGQKALEDESKDVVEKDKEDGEELVHRMARVVEVPRPLLPLTDAEKEQDRTIWSVFQQPPGKADESLLRSLVVCSTAPGRDVSYYRRFSDWETALMAVSYHGHRPSARALLDAGADMCAKDRHGRTAWTFAGLSGHEREMEELVGPEQCKQAKTRDGDLFDYFVVDTLDYEPIAAPESAAAADHEDDQALWDTLASDAAAMQDPSVNYTLDHPDFQRWMQDPEADLPDLDFTEQGDSSDGYGELDSEDENNPKNDYPDEEEEDLVDENDEWEAYQYQDDEMDTPDNRRLRRAIEAARNGRVWDPEDDDDIEDDQDDFE